MSVPAGTPSAAPQIQSAKSALRRRLLAARAGRPADPIEAAALLAVPEISAATVVAAYAPLPGEPDVLTPLLGLARSVLLPVIEDDLGLTFRLPSGPLVPGRLAVPTPPAASPVVDLGSADVVFVPALAADRSGNRLGRGKGSYDRVLSRIRPGALLIAVVQESELLEAVPVEAHDVTVGAVLAGTTLIRVAR